MPLAQLLSLIAPPLCWSCGGSAPGANPLCRSCRGALRWLAPEPVELLGIELWAPLAYDGPARALVHGLKFRGAAPLAQSMAAQIAANAPASLFRDRLLVPVPLSAGRARRRGFNQATLLARALGARTGRPMDDCLERRRGSAPQVGRARDARLAAVAGAVTLADGVEAPDAALLVDDVVTTGSTLAACAHALRDAGTRDVAAVTYARTPGR